MRLTVFLFAIFGLAAPFTTQAQTYNWLTWTSPSAATAQAVAPGLGTIQVTASGAGPVVTLVDINFLNVAFTPTSAHTAGPGHNQQGAWSALLDFSAISNTQGLIVGIGNMAYGTAGLPGYQFSATNTANSAISPAAFLQIGSYDHQWVNPPVATTFNDNVSLNTSTSKFNFVTVAGGDNNNSDILLLALPAGVKTILIASDGPTGGDTINVLAALPVPEPESYMLMLSGLALLAPVIRRRRSSLAREK